MRHYNSTVSHHSIAMKLHTYIKNKSVCIGNQHTNIISAIMKVTILVVLLFTTLTKANDKHSITRFALVHGKKNGKVQCMYVPSVYMHVPAHHPYIALTFTSDH